MSVQSNVSTLGGVMKIITASNGQKKLTMNKEEWEKIGKRLGWTTEAKKKSSGKKKTWDPNPWAVCNKSVGTKKTPKRERCIQHVKEQQS